MQKTWSSLVKKNFNAAALNYNESALIQRSTALKLAKICSQHPINNGLWVDLGSGTGLLAKSLEVLHPSQNVLRLDNSKQMIDQHSDKNPKQLWDFNLKELSISTESETFRLNLEEGAHKMLYSGKWDATSQLLDEEERIKNKVKNLPYLNNFKYNI